MVRLVWGERVRSSLVAFLLLVCLAVPGRALAVEGPGQSATAVVAGRVLGPDHNPVPGVQVQLRAGAKTLDQGVTGPDGAFRIEGVPAPGVYRIVCSVGSIVEKGPEVTLTGAGEVAAVDVTLKLRLSEQVSVTADAWTLPKDVPNSVAIKTAEKLAEQNLFNPEDALRYAPSTVIRKRYIGDRNALLGGRSFGTLQPSRGLVFLDGYLLSNFLGRFDAPRWNMVTPEALERVDILYGPFSAIHAGNSIGTTVVMTERTPVRLEWGASVTGYGQGFDQYGESDNYRGGQLSAYVGGRFESGWGALTYNHQDSISQPMQYFNVDGERRGRLPGRERPGHARVGDPLRHRPEGEPAGGLRRQRRGDRPHAPGQPEAQARLRVHPGAGGERAPGRLDQRHDQQQPHVPARRGRGTRCGKGGSRTARTRSTSRPRPSRRPRATRSTASSGSRSGAGAPWAGTARPWSPTTASSPTRRGRRTCRTPSPRTAAPAR